MLLFQSTSACESVQNACLNVISLYIDWVDVELIANDDFIPLLLERLGNKKTSEVSFDLSDLLIFDFYGLIFDLRCSRRRRQL